MSYISEMRKHIGHAPMLSVDATVIVIKDGKILLNLRSDTGTWAVYCTLIMIVYFTQITTVANEHLNEQAAMLIDFRKHGLISNYDLLGYGMMVLSTFFTGLSMKARNKVDKWLKVLLIVHGVFFPPVFSCQ